MDHLILMVVLLAAIVLGGFGIVICIAPVDQLDHVSVVNLLRVLLITNSAVALFVGYRIMTP